MVKASLVRPVLIIVQDFSQNFIVLKLISFPTFSFVLFL